jgi:hypothetical protein
VGVLDKVENLALNLIQCPFREYLPVDPLRSYPKAFNPRRGLVHLPVLSLFSVGL